MTKKRNKHIIHQVINMLNLDYLQQLLAIAIVLSTITCAIVQKTKSCFKKSKYLCIYSFAINILVGIVFCYTFTDIKLPTSFWIGFFSFLGADTIYKSLEGKLASHKDLIAGKTVTIAKENIINKEAKK